MDAHFDDILGAAPAEAPPAEEPAPKRARVEDGEGGEDIEALVARAEQLQALELTPAGVRGLCAGLAKKALRNQTLRLEHPDDPMRFIDSELELDEAVKALAAVAAAPQLYPVAVAAGLGDTLAELLAHPNTDIVLTTLNSLAELTEADAMAEDVRGALALVDGVVDKGVLELLLRLLQARLDETKPEDARGVHLVLTVVENVCEARPELVDRLCAGRGELLPYLVARVRQRGFDPNKLYASELLSILLGAGDDVQRAFGAPDGLDGVEQLLRGIAQYRKKDPDSPEELEFAHNLFHCLCSALMLPDNRTRFRRLEGMELMQRCMKERKFARFNALKAVDYALSDSPSSCAHWVAIGGLKQLFPLFMGRSKSKGSKVKQSAGEEVEYEEHAVSAVAALCAQLPPVAQTGDAAFRVAAKFVEGGFEKTDRLAELFLKFYGRVGRCNDAQAARQARKAAAGASADSDDDDDDDDDDLDSPEALYLQRLDAGLFTLQRLSLVMGRVAAENPDVRARLARQLGQEEVALEMAQAVLLEYAETLGDDDDEGVEAQRQRARGWAAALQQ